ncbi:MAG: DNA polymerase I [Lachnospiraceae bacterium]|nr:DNA polymerase I [Lachnospiraceae bacterium]
MSERIVLIDGHSILNRAFYGVPDLTTAAGLHTNAVYGFLNILFKLIDEEKPQYLIVAFDTSAPTFRHGIFKEYKGTRKPMPEELRMQVPVIKEVLEAMGIPIFSKEGLEADDILGTIAKRSEEKGLEVSLVSGDRDLLQIASEHIKIRIPKTKGGKTEIEDYYASDVLETYGVTPEGFIELKALQGDTADNIPGVPKVGEKTARELMVTYKSLDGIYEHLEEITKNAIRESLRENRNLADLSKVLATIKTDCEIDLSLDNAKTEGYFNPKAYELFKKLEFKNMLGRFEGNVRSASVADFSEHFRIVTDFTEVEAVFDKAAGMPYVGFDCLFDGKNLVGAAVVLSDEEAYYVPVAGFVSKDYLRDRCKDINKSSIISTCDVKHQYSLFDSGKTECFFDIVLAAYIINPLKNDYSYVDVASEYLGLTIPNEKELFGKDDPAKLFDTEEKKVSDYLCTKAYIAFKAYTILKDKLKELEMLSLYEEIEMPLTAVLYDMEKEGILVDRDALKAYGDALVGRIEELESSIKEAAGTDFNINSPKQLGEVLFEKLGLPGGKKTKSGYSTAADVLEKLAEDYPIVVDILEYRGLTKLKSTYADGLANYIEEDNRIHTNFNQTITATGRISSTEPNLQNIPMRTEMGRRIRKVFIPKKDYVFVDADYSQIELRILAHMSGDKNLIEAYNKAEDIHAITASEVFHTPLNEVTPLQRRNAKAVNFGIVYGISSFGLSQGLSISRKEAKEYIDQYFKSYPGVKAFLDGAVSFAKDKGYSRTLFNRRRPIPELSSSNFMQRSFGERVAMNAPIQGTAADIMKIAMIRVAKRLKDDNLKAKVILQVHDELLIEAPKEETESVVSVLREEMGKAANLAVALEVDVHSGDDWFEAK